MRLFHGSYCELPNPDPYFNDHINNCSDHGYGFYLSNNYEYTKFWAGHVTDQQYQCPIESDEAICYVNIYEFDDWILTSNELNILNYLDGTHTLLEWIATMAYHRGILSHHNSTHTWLTNFAIDSSQYDIILAYRADDSLLNITTAFLEGEISIEEAKKRLTLGVLGYEIIVKNNNALQFLHFIKSDMLSSACECGHYSTVHNKINRTLSKRISIPIDGLFIDDIQDKIYFDYNGELCYNTDEDYEQLLELITIPHCWETIYDIYND